MAEYAYKDIIVDPNDPRVEIGAEYYFGDNVGALLYGVRTGGETQVLQDVYNATDEYSPFYNGRAGFSCIIRKKVLSYAERQARWIADNDVKVGDKVRVTRKAQSYEDEWSDNWTEHMDDWVGKVFEVGSFYPESDSGIRLVDDYGGFWTFPYFVLEKVELEYVPFDLGNEEDKARLRGAWIREKKTGIEYQVIGLGDSLIFLEYKQFDTGHMLERYEFLDGTPCGKLAEEVE